MKNQTKKKRGQQQARQQDQQRCDPARKHDAGKLRYDLIPTRPLEALARTYTEGAATYGDENWREGMSWKRVYGAIMRHLEASRAGRDVDPDSGCLSLASAAWGCFTLMEFLYTHPEYDDRVRDE